MLTDNLTFVINAAPAEAGFFVAMLLSFEHF
jgi:hypothetical protein